MAPHVVVYDPDNLNPYGREVAGLLREQVVELVGTTQHEWVPDGVTLKRSVHLRPAAGVLKAIIGQVCTLVRLTSAIARGHHVVVCWTRTAADGFVLGLLGRMSGRVLTVVHNPVPRRRTGRLESAAERWLRSGSTCVLHDQSLLGLAGKEVRHALVVDHPPYAELARVFARGPRSAVRGRVAVVGQLRPDKSPSDTAAVLAALPRDAGVSVQFVGKGALTDELREASAGLGLVDSMAREGVDDEQLVSAVREASVVLAPYRGATQSGTVLLALTLHVPVVAYDVGAIATHVPPERLAPLGDHAAMARLVLRVLADPGQEPQVDVGAWTDRVASDWASAVRR